MAMNATKGGPTHPGVYVRRHVIPEGMTVTKAAALLGVGRPALSNFLNGKAALSPEMALRLARTFRADSEALLDLQARFARREEAARRPVITGAHAPALVSIKAADIDRWADRIEARQELPALLRRLIHSTGHDLVRVDFPAYDNAERPGWDGRVETSTPTPWIPNGKSGWEFSCKQDPGTKAEKDYKVRLRSVPLRARREHSFVFVTPRNWKKGVDWAKKKAALGDWRDVRAYDANDIEQWLEQSAPTQIWFAERVGILIRDYRSLDRCWTKWAEVCDPALSTALFDPIVEDSSADFKRWQSEPPGRPFIVAAASRDEALAFLCCLIDKAKSDTNGPDAGVVVFDTPEAMSRFDASAAVPRIAVVHDPEVEKEIGRLYRRCHCIIVRPVNDVDAEPDIRLELLGGGNFADALKAMGLSEERIERLAQESARSLTILRRRLSIMPAIRTPAWSGDPGTARKLLPATLVGAWHNASPADREIIRLLAKADDHSDVENNIAALLALEDAPVWSAGEYRGVVSRIDALFGIAKFVTKPDLESFMFVAECVLSETDPALGLPEDGQWMAAVYGKVRDHSDALRRGIRETLILLAVFGKRLFRKRLGFDAETQVADLVHKLLIPLDRERIRSHNEDLTDYAEAAPEEFLSLLENDLQQSAPAVQELMRPANTPFSSPLRTHLLWALEGLAWTSQNFPRVVEVLAKLCTTGEDEAQDNWVNRPENTLASLFRSWLPQTSAPLGERIQTFEKLCRNYPTLGWSICVGHLYDGGPRHAIPNHRPRWRDDAANAGRGVIDHEDRGFVRKVSALARDWPHHDENTLSDLVQRIECFSEEDQLRIWDSIDSWADSTPSEDTKAYLRQRIHASAHIRHRANTRVLHVDRERAASAKLMPTDLVTRHAWLFKSHWVELPPDDAENEEFDYEKHNQRLHEMRLESVRDIWNTSGFKGVEALLGRAEETSHQVGDLMTEILAWNDATAEFVNPCIRIAAGDNGSRFKSCLAGFLWKAESGYIARLVDQIEHAPNPDTLLVLLLCLPYGAATWLVLEDKTEKSRNAYWRQVEPRVWPDRHTEEEINRSIDELLLVHRAQAAFRAVHMLWNKVGTSQLIKLLDALAATNSENFPKLPDFDYYISKAFDALDKRSGVSVEEKARLEFAYLPLLDRSKHGIPNVEEQIAASPQFYVQAISYAFERANGGEDPHELLPKDSEKRRVFARNFHQLLDRLRRIPGTDAHGEIDAVALKDWLRQVRDFCTRHDRADIADYKIGKLLSHAPSSDDDVWPCAPVCEALEWMASERAGRGFMIGTRNRRGAYLKGEGGDQERDLAARYRGWANKLVYKYPYVGSVLEEIGVSYDRDAERQDTESETRKRLPY